MFRLKVHRSGKEVLVAASDADLVGRTFRENGLKITVHPSFYSDVDADEERLLAALRTCTVANLVGENVVRFAIENGFVDKLSVLRIEGVPHAQLAVM